MNFFRDVIAKIIKADFEGHTKFSVADEKAVGDDPIRTLSLDAVPVGTEVLISLAWEGGDKLFEKKFSSEEAQHQFSLISNDLAEAVALTQKGEYDAAKAVMQTLSQKYSENTGDIVPTNLPPVNTTQGAMDDVWDHTNDDQPVTCPSCGSRTDFIDLGKGMQNHECLDPNCKKKFLVHASQDGKLWREAKITMQNLFFSSTDELMEFQKKMKELNPGDQDGIPLWDKMKGDKGEAKEELAAPSLSYEQVEKNQEKDTKNLDKRIQESVKTELESQLEEKKATMFTDKDKALVDSMRGVGRNWDEIKKYMVKELDYDKDSVDLYIDDLRTKADGTPSEVVPEEPSAPRPPKEVVSPETHDKLVQDIKDKKEHAPVEEVKEKEIEKVDTPIKEESAKASVCQECDGEGSVPSVRGGRVIATTCPSCKGDTHISTTDKSIESATHEIARADNTEIAKQAIKKSDKRYLVKQAANPIIDPNLPMLMKQLADATGAEWDGGDDTRLFLENQHNVWADAMTPEQYAAMEKDLATFEIKGQGYSVYAAYDVSGYEYWKREGTRSSEQDTGSGNYIMITAFIEPEAIGSIDPNKLRDDMETVSDHFAQYENTEVHFERPITTASLKVKADDLNPLQEPPVAEAPTTPTQDVVPFEKSQDDHDAPQHGDRVFVTGDMGSEKAGFEGEFISDYMSGGTKMSIILNDNGEEIQVESHRVVKTSEGSVPAQEADPIQEPHIDVPDNDVVPTTPSLAKLTSSKHSKCIKCDTSHPVEDMIENAHGAGLLCKTHAKAWNADPKDPKDWKGTSQASQDSLMDIKAEADALLKMVKEAESSVVMPMMYGIDDDSILQYANGSIYKSKIDSGEMQDSDWQALVRETGRWMTQVGKQKVSQTFSQDAEWKLDPEQINKLKSMFEVLPKTSASLKTAFDKGQRCNICGTVDLYAKSTEPWECPSCGNQQSPKQVFAGASAPLECDHCHAPMGPMTQSHLENTEDGGQVWHCDEKKASDFEKGISQNKTADDVAPQAATFMAVYSVYKMVTEFNEESQDWSGRTSDFGGIDKGTMEVANVEEALAKIQEKNFLQHPFEAVPDEPGRYEMNQVEDQEGYADETGKFLCDYTCTIKLYKEAAMAKKADPAPVAPVEQVPTKMKDVKITPDHVDKSMAVPATEEQAQVIQRMQHIESNLKALDLAKEEVTARLKAELQKIDNAGERNTLEAEYKGQIEKLAVLIDAVDNKLIKYNDMFINFQQEEKTQQPKIDYKDVLDRVAAKIPGVDKLVQSILNGFMSLAKDITTRTVTRWPEKRSTLEKHASSVTEQLAAINEEMLLVLQMLS